MNPVTPFITQFLFQNLFVQSKKGCLQKSRAPYFLLCRVIRIFSLKKTILFSWKLFLHKKLSTNQSIFKIRPKFFVYMVSDRPLEIILLLFSQIWRQKCTCRTTYQLNFLCVILSSGFGNTTTAPCRDLYQSWAVK